MCVGRIGLVAVNDVCVGGVDANWLKRRVCGCALWRRLVRGNGV